MISRCYQWFSREMTEERRKKFYADHVQYHYPDVGSASDWSCREGNLLQPIGSSTLI